MSTIDTMASGSTLLGSSMRSKFGKVFRALWAHQLTKRELRRSRLDLFELSDGALEDIGLTREVADREAARSLLACYLNNSR
jgi:uncharacterized protein YjiS (DUF1127 family)